MKTIRLIIFLTIALFTHFAHAQTNEMDKAKADIAELLNHKFAFYDTEKFPSFSSHLVPQNILVLDDRIEIILKKSIRTFYFTDDLNIPVGSNYITIGNTMFMEKKAGNVKELVDNLVFVQNQLNEKHYRAQLILFEPVAMAYRTLEVKPLISEEQREYIVQANSFNDEKNYLKAIELYKKVIETDQTSYPAAYSNLALLSAQLHGFNAAVFYMKMYLLLEPDASDARSAQDKIYEWKARIAQ